MALPTSGAISLNDIHVEAGGATGTLCSINDTDIRALISSTAGTTVSFDDYYGASASKSVQFDIEGGRGGIGDLNGQYGSGGSTKVTYALSSTRSFILRTGGRGEDGNASNEAGGGGAASFVTTSGSNFAVTIGVGGGGGGAGYADLGTTNRGKGGVGTGYSGIWTSFTSYPYYITPGGNGYSDDSTPTNFPHTGGSAAEARGGQGGGQNSTNRTLGGGGGTGRYNGNAGSNLTSTQGGLSSLAGGRGGENSAANSNANGGQTTTNAFEGGIGGNAVDVSDSGGGGGGGGAPSGGGGAGGAYGAGGGGGGGAAYDGTSLNSIPNLTPTAKTGTNGARADTGRIRVYIDGVLNTTLTGSGVNGTQNLTYQVTV